MLPHVMFAMLLVGFTSAAFSDNCDKLVPEYCMLPYPNDFWRIETSKGFRLNFTDETFPIDDKGKKIDPVRGGWNDLHGFPVMPAITAYFRGVDESSIESCAHWWNVEKSETDESLTVLLDAETMKPVPHWVELDHSSAKAEKTGKHAFMIWPATALEFNRRYIVAIKSLNDANGRPVEPSPAFRALRDRNISEPDLLLRSGKFEDIFTRLEKAGVQRGKLLLTWDFTTNDKQDVTGRMVSARDDARARIGTDGPEYKIISIDDQSAGDGLVAKIIHGVFSMPSYLNTHDPLPAARMVLDANNNAVYQGNQWFNFEVVVPKAFVDKPASAGVLQYGHGLFGTLHEVDYGSSTYMYEDATDYGYVICASTWIGLSEYDLAAVGLILLNDTTDFMYVPDRTTQGVINALGLMTMMKGRFSRDPAMLTSAGESIIAPDKTAYFGNSEGGIFGAVYMAVTQDVTRGLLGVPGGPYGLLLPRSLDFGMEFDAMKVRYSDPVDRINMMQVMQMLWDRAEPAGYMSSISRAPLPGTPSHQVLLHYGLGDAQVSWLGAQVVARSVDAVMFNSSAREHSESFFGMKLLADSEVVAGQSGIQGWDFMSAQAPLVNTPPGEEGDTHEKPRRDPRAQQQMGHFFLTGEIKNFCGGVCVAEP